SALPRPRAPTCSGRPARRAPAERRHAGRLRHPRREPGAAQRRPRALSGTRFLGDRKARRGAYVGDALAPLRHGRRRPTRPRPRRRRRDAGRSARPPRRGARPLMFTQLLGEHLVHTALWAGAVAAVVSGAVGVFVVARGMSFAVHAISELGFTGAAAALVIGIDPVLGILGGSLLVGLMLGLLSVRGRERDSALGAVLAFGLGLG